MKHFFLLSMTLLLANVIPTNSFAQQLKHCATNEVLEQYYQAHPELYQSFVNNENHYNTLLQTARINTVDTAVYIIPVVFHVLHENGSENISKAQILDGLAILNRDCRKRNADTINVIAPFRHLISDLRVEFRLAQLDPQGNCTDGIDRIYTSKTNYGNDSAKVNSWPRDKYLNIWTVKQLEHTDWAAYAYYPSAATGSLSTRDGILTLHNYVGSIGTSSPISSRTLTHEVGHWLDLGHPWNRTINISINVGLACGDDGVSDTPITKGHTICPDLLTPDCRIDTFSTGYFNFHALTVSSGTVDPSPLDTLFNELNVVPFKAVGVSINPTRDSVFSYSDWPLGAINNETNYSALTGTINQSKYYEVTVSPRLAYSMTLKGFSFAVNRSNKGPRTFAIRSSMDGFAANLTASVAPTNTNVSVQSNQTFFYNNDTILTEYGNLITVSGAQYTNRDIPVTFRIYAWNAEDQTGSFGIDSVSIIGTAGTIENIQNFMEYSNCENMFTTGQKNRMRLAMQSTISGRSNLWSPANLAATGVLNPPTTCVLKPDFYVSRTRLCVGNTITFTKNILNGTETSRNWTFQGGTPATSTATAPTIMYTAPGLYSVTLTATNAAGTATISKTQYIRVDPTLADVDYNGSYTEGFESATILNHDWQVADLDNNGHTWFLATNSGIGNTNAVGVNAYNSYYPDVDELFSPSYDLTNNPTPSFSFKVAAASTSTVMADIKDELKVYFSTDCGNSWLQRATYTTTTLINNPAQASAFVPNNSTTWTTNYISIPTFFQTSKLRVKFQYKSSGVSNNIYIDNINLSAAVGIEENNQLNNYFTISPNPSNDQAMISYRLSSNSTVKLEVLDVLGKQLVEIVKSNQSEGDYGIPLSKHEHGFANGVYFVRLTVGNKASTQKLIITE